MPFLARWRDKSELLCATWVARILHLTAPRSRPHTLKSKGVELFWRPVSISTILPSSFVSCSSSAFFIASKSLACFSFLILSAASDFSFCRFFFSAFSYICFISRDLTLSSSSFSSRFFIISAVLSLSGRISAPNVHLLSGTSSSAICNFCIIIIILNLMS